MTNTQRVAALVVFILAMLGVRQIAHAAVAGGPIPWLICVGLIFAAGVWLENRQRAVDDRPPYSLAEARELVLPLTVAAGIFAVAWLLS